MSCCGFVFCVLCRLGFGLGFMVAYCMVLHRVGWGGSGSLVCSVAVLRGLGVLDLICRVAAFACFGWVWCSPWWCGFGCCGLGCGFGAEFVLFCGGLIVWCLLFLSWLLVVLRVCLCLRLVCSLVLACCLIA